MYIFTWMKQLPNKHGVLQHNSWNSTMKVGPYIHILKGMSDYWRVDSKNDKIDSR